MRDGPLSRLWNVTPNAWPVILEGRWLGASDGEAWVASNPVSVLEGDGKDLKEFPPWVAWHAAKYPTGAAIGFLSYELARHFEAVPLLKFDTLPDFCFAYYSYLEKLTLGATTDRAGEAACTTEFSTNIDETTYSQAIEKIRDYIAAGDIYQANLTVQFRVGLGGQSPERIYQRLRCGGAPFRACWQTPRRTILSDSPERFFRVRGNHILASPIKGTIARGADDDRTAREQLLSSAKDRAENVMIVDLLRNDLGRLCRPGSIRIVLWETEALPHLFHLVSHVEGTLRPGTGIAEILRAVFPCGSITGAPKIRAMEILAEIEKTARGISMGSLGIICGVPGSDRCTMEFNVAIRTMLIESGTAVFNVGGGIVYDSSARSEYEEMMLKARPLLAALGALEAGKQKPVNAST